MPSKAATTPKRFIEILPVDLLRDAGAGASPLHCDISLGGRSAQSCELGGSAAALTRVRSSAPSPPDRPESVHCTPAVCR